MYISSVYVGIFDRMSLAAHYTLDAELRNDEWTGGLAAHLSARQTLEALMRGKVAYSLASSPHSLFSLSLVVSFQEAPIRMTEHTY